MTALRLEDPRAKLAMLLLCVLCAMLAPSLYFQFALVTLIGVLAALSGRWRYAVKGVDDPRHGGHEALYHGAGQKAQVAVRHGGHGGDRRGAGRCDGPSGAVRRRAA